MTIHEAKYIVDDEWLKAVSDAGSALATMQAKGLHRVEKRDGSFTTEADVESQRILIGYFHRRYPDLPLLVEEESIPIVKQAVQHEFAGVRLLDASETMQDLPPTYVSIDPADGTVFLGNGSPEFAVSAAIVDQGQPVAGAVYQPIQRHLFAYPTSLCEMPRRASGVKPLRSSLVGLDLSRSVASDFRVRVIDRLVSCCAYPENLTAVVSGIHLLHGVTAAWVSCNAWNWDVAATALLVTEAGGCAWHLAEDAGCWNVAPIPWNVVRMPPLLFATSQHVVEEILDVLNGHGP